jgi:uncharacterized membrane protein
MAAPLLWIGVTVVFAIIVIAMNFVPVIGNIAASLLTPVFAGGLLLGCHALARGQPLEFDHLFAGFGQGRAGRLMVLGLLAFVAGLAVALVLMTLVFGAIGLSGLVAMMRGDPSMMAHGAAAGMGIGALLAIPLAFLGYGLFVMAWFFAPALCALNRAEALAAIKASFDASWKNLGAVALFVLIFIGLAIVATIPIGLGWLVLAPVTIGAAYAGWREVFSE